MHEHSPGTNTPRLPQSQDTGDGLTLTRMLVEQKHDWGFVLPGMAFRRSRGGEGSSPLLQAWQLPRLKWKSLGDCGIPSQLKLRASGYVAISSYLDMVAQQLIACSGLHSIADHSGVDLLSSCPMEFSLSSKTLCQSDLRKLSFCFVVFITPKSLLVWL